MGALATTAGDAAGRERRRHPRYEVDGVAGSLWVSLEGRLLNLSLDGLAIEIGQQLKVGHSYVVRLSDGGQERRVQGEVVWCRRRGAAGEDARRPIFHAGLHFDASVPGAMRDLQPYLAAPARAQVERRLRARFAVQGRRAAGLSLTAPCRVVRISLSGVEIRAEAPLEPGTPLELELRTAEAPLALRGRVIEARPQEPPAVLLGIEFVEPDAEVRDALRHLIASVAG